MSRETKEESGIAKGAQDRVGRPKRGRIKRKRQGPMEEWPDKKEDL